MFCMELMFKGHQKNLKLCIVLPSDKLDFCQVFYASVELITDWTYVDMLHILLPDEISHYVAAGWYVFIFCPFSIVFVHI